MESRGLTTVITNYSMHLAIIVLSFPFYLTGITKCLNVSYVISLPGIVVLFLLVI